MPETVICAPVRTAVGRYGGVFKDVPAAAGLPVEVPGVQLDRRCGSGLQAVIWAVMQVQTGAIEVVLAGGAESMSQVEFYSPSVRWGPGGEQIVFHDRLGRVRVTAGGIHDLVPGGMLETAENLRARSRTSLRSGPISVRSRRRKRGGSTTRSCRSRSQTCGGQGLAALFERVA
jgi:acetyl-CoA C-acetyltransferase